MHRFSNRMRWLALAGMFVALAGSSCQSPKPGKPPRIEPRRPGGLERFNLQHAGRDRYFYLYMPPAVKPRTSLPVILVLHGEGQTPDDVIGMAGFNALADLHKFAVIYPAGTGNNTERLHWNILRSGTYASVNRVDDFGFLDAVLAAVDAKIKIDEDRVYAAGFSHGGMFCFRLACDPVWSQKLAAIATVGAVLPIDPQDCQGVDALPLIAFHGTDDPFSPYRGGIAREAPRNDRTARPGYPETIAFWTERHALAYAPEPDASRGDATMQCFKSPTSAVEVISWELQGGGHTWPGGAAVLPVWIAGMVNRDVNATSEIWNFFQRHSRRSTR